MTTTVQPAADLQVGITASPTPVQAGQNVQYTITATNNGLSSATGVVVTDTIPSGVTFVSATGGVTPDDNGNLTFSVGNLAADAFDHLDRRRRDLGDHAHARHWIKPPSRATEYDPNSSNNTATSSVPITPVEPAFRSPCPARPTRSTWAAT